MEIVCAGYWKTGSKSCSSALRELGYKVADAVETADCFSYIWRDYLDGEITIEDVVKAYVAHGFDANQDLPGNFLAYELFKASPSAKVILTVRDDEKAWEKSWRTYMLQEISRFGNPLCYIFNKFQDWGYMGPKASAFFAAQEFCMAQACPGFDIKKRFFTWQAQYEYTMKKLDKSVMGYQRHNAFIQSVIPKDRLLIWNVKDGWEPLCKFLGKPVPNTPIPHDNKTGDTKFMEEYFFTTDYAKECQKHLLKNVSLLLLKTILVSGFTIHEFRTDFKYSRKISAKILSAVNQFSAKIK